jgi:hypothetical protein
MEVFVQSWGFHDGTNVDDLHLSVRTSLLKMQFRSFLSYTCQETFAL